MMYVDHENQRTEKRQSVYFHSDSSLIQWTYDTCGSRRLRQECTSVPGLSRASLSAYKVIEYRREHQRTEKRLSVFFDSYCNLMRWINNIVLNMKTLIRMHSCADWPWPSLSAYRIIEYWWIYQRTENVFPRPPKWYYLFFSCFCKQHRSRWDGSMSRLILIYAVWHSVCQLDI